MNELMNFDFNSNQVRIFTIEGEPWFTAKDLANILEYSRTNKMLQLVDKKDRKHINPHNFGGTDITQSFGANTFKLAVVNESGLYACIFGSTKPEAKEFKKWVTSEVLPQIRLTGSYNLNPDKKQLPQTYLEALKELVASEEKRQLAEQQAEKAITELNQANDSLDTYRAIFSPEACLTVNQVAKGLGIASLGRNSMYNYLRRRDFIQQKPSLEPYQKRIDEGLAVVETITVDVPKTHTTTRKIAKQQAKFTFKGLEWLVKRLIKDKYPVDTTPKEIWDYYNSDSTNTNTN